MTRFTAIAIQANPDFSRESGYGIDVDASGPHENGKWAGWISLWRDRRPHISPLISTDPIYDTAEDAKAAMAKLVEDVRRVDATKARS